MHPKLARSSTIIAKPNHQYKDQASNSTKLYNPILGFSKQGNITPIVKPQDPPLASHKLLWRFTHLHPTNRNTQHVHITIQGTLVLSSHKY